MALVTSLIPSSKDRQSVHEPTRCRYAIVNAPDGQRYLQLDTLGSDERAFPNKVSQSLQFDRQAPGQLLHILRVTFPDLVEDGGSESHAGELSVTEDDEEGAVEGRELFRLHRQKERNQRLTWRKKRKVLAVSGRLGCEVCGFDFAAVYGSLGDGFAECHHRTPLSELDGTTKTKLSDLAIVCANCHRMLHRHPAPTVEQLCDMVLAHRVRTGG